MSKQEELVKQLSELTVLELSELKKALEGAWGVEASAASVAVAAPAAAAAAVEESTEFNVILEEVPAPKKISVIKAVREATGLGLKEAKAMTEGAPITVKEDAPKAEAEELKKKLEDAGAKASIKGV